MPTPDQGPPLALSPPRRFELFAGDLLQYVGLQHVAVTRYIGDGGIDAHGELVAVSNLVRIDGCSGSNARYERSAARH